MLKFQFDQFQGVIIDPLSAPDSRDLFHQHLGDLITHAHSECKQLIWLTLAIDKAHLIAAATDQGFVFHNCLEQELTLILRLNCDAYAPFMATHSIGAGAVVIDKQDRVLVIKEKKALWPGYKLPGGHVELGEQLAEAVVREVLEETGVVAEFESVLGFASKHPYQFGKSNTYFVCRLTPRSNQIDIRDTDEIEDAKWIDINTYLADEDNILFNRQIVEAARNNQGLKPMILNHQLKPHERRETFFVQPNRD